MTPCYTRRARRISGRSGDPPRLLHPRGRRQRRHVRVAELRLRLRRRAGQGRSATARSPRPGSGCRPIGSVSCHQVHGTDRDHGRSRRGGARTTRAPTAMVTAVPGIALGVLAADCAPVLFADPEARIIGAAHGGWRGALAGVMEATVAAMTRLGARAERIRAGIGPCIAQPSYEVGAGIPRNLYRCRSGQPRLSSGRRRVPAIFCSICRAISRSACRVSASPRSSARRTTPRPRRSCSSAIGAPACAAKRITAAVSRRSRSRPDRAMPYLVMFGVICLLGLLATCAML